MTESVQLLPSANAGAPASKGSDLDPINNLSSADTGTGTGFISVLASYLDSEPVATVQQIDEDLAAMLAALLPQEMLEDGNVLPDEKNSPIWLALLSLQPIENSQMNTGALTHHQGTSLLDIQRRLNFNSPLLNQDYMQTVANKMNAQPDQAGFGDVAKGLVSQLTLLQASPDKNDTVLLNTLNSHDQLIPNQGTSSNLANGLATFGFGTATQSAATQSQTAQLSLGQHGWESNLGSRLQMLIGQNVQNAEIRLDPPELGTLDIKIKITNDTATVNFTSQHPQVREALESAVPRLREMFAESGLSLGDVNVKQESFAQQEKSTEELESFARNSDARMQDDDLNEVTRKIVSNNMLDTYA